MYSQPAPSTHPTPAPLAKKPARPVWHAPALVFFTGFVIVLTSIVLFMLFSSF